MEVLREFGLRFIREFQLGTVRHDFAIPSLALIVELDGPTGHSRPAQRRRDAWRDEQARLQKWEVLRVSIPRVAEKLRLELCSRLNRGS
jgi:very-short-patch-repair endonuclease